MRRPPVAALLGTLTLGLGLLVLAPPAVQADCLLSANGKCYCNDNPFPVPRKFCTGHSGTALKPGDVKGTPTHPSPAPAPAQR